MIKNIKESPIFSGSFINKQYEGNLLKLNAYYCNEYYYIDDEFNILDKNKEFIYKSNGNIRSAYGILISILFRDVFSQHFTYLESQNSKLNNINYPETDLNKNNFINLSRIDNIKMCLYCANLVAKTELEKEAVELLKSYLKSSWSIKKEQLSDISNKLWSKGLLATSWAVYSPMNFIIIDNHTKQTVRYVLNSSPSLEMSIKNYLSMLLRKEKQFNIPEHNNKDYEKSLKNIIFSDIDAINPDKFLEFKDIVKKYYNINLDLNLEERVLIETVRREFKVER